VPPCEQEFGEVAADAPHSAGCSGHEDRVVVFMVPRHGADHGLLKKDELATRRAGSKRSCSCCTAEKRDEIASLHVPSVKIGAGNAKAYQF
jgi:hypothetical protein